MSENPVVDGVVKWFDLSKGFGFVVSEGVSKDILLHVNVVRQSGRNAVAAGDTVTLELSESERGLQAVALHDVVEAAVGMPGTDHHVPAADDDVVPARLKWFDKGKGYGFLNAFGSSEDVFVHVDVLRTGGMLDAGVGEAMCAVVAEGTKGASAIAVYPWDAARAWKATQHGQSEPVA
ncbi:MAG: cold shock domain-containing protein [Pseudomonadota bacterium]